MLYLKILIQLISIYRAVSISVFILFYPILPSEINSIILTTAAFSDLVDGYLARKFQLATIGGKLLDLFSDKYLNCVSLIFLIIEGYPLLPLIVILFKEIFVLSFRSIEIDGAFIVSTNRTLGGILSGILWLTVLLHINYFSSDILNDLLLVLGIINFFYLVYKIVANFSNLKIVFQEKI